MVITVAEVKRITVLLVLWSIPPILPAGPGDSPPKSGSATTRAAKS